MDAFATNAGERGLMRTPKIIKGEPYSNYRCLSMTPEQIENFRNAMAFTYGPLIRMLPDEQIEMLQRRMQAEINIESRTTERIAKREKAKRKGICSHGVAAKYCRACK